MSVDGLVFDPSMRRWTCYTSFSVWIYFLDGRPSRGRIAVSPHLCGVVLPQQYRCLRLTHTAALLTHPHYLHQVNRVSTRRPLALLFGHKGDPCPASG